MGVDMHHSYLMIITERWGRARSLIITQLIGILILTAFADASDSLYVKYIEKADTMFLAQKYDSSFIMAQQARDEAVRLHGEEDTLVARALYRMGGCCYMLSDASAAESHWTASLAIREKLRGPNHLEVAECLSALATIAYDRMQFVGAESLFVRAADILEPLQGKGQIKLVQILNELANTESRMGHYPQAEHLYYRALDVARQVFGESHATYLALMTNIGLILIRMGNNEAALDILQRARTLTEEKYGPQSPNLHAILNSIGLIYRRYAEYYKAASYFERVVRIIEGTPEDDDTLLAVPLLNLGKIYRAVGDLTESERCLLRHLDIVKKYGDGSALESAATMTTLARIYYDRGDSLVFLEHYRHALSAYEESLDAKYLNLPSELMTFSNYFRPYDGDVSLKFARHGFELRRNYLLSNYLKMTEAEALRFSWFMREAASYYLSAYLDLKPDDSLTRVTAADIIFTSKGQVSDEIFERKITLYENASPEILALRDSLGQAKNTLSSLYVSGYDENSRDSLLSAIDRLETSLAECGSDRVRLREPHNITTDHILDALPEGCKGIPILFRVIFW